MCGGNQWHQFDLHQHVGYTSNVPPFGANEWHQLNLHQHVGYTGYVPPFGGARSGDPYTAVAADNIRDTNGSMLPWRWCMPLYFAGGEGGGLQ